MKMRFLLIEEQANGCDYTIGCGVRLTYLNVENAQDAAKQAIQKIAGDGTHSNPGCWPTGPDDRHDYLIDKARILAITAELDLAPALDAIMVERAQEAIRQDAKSEDEQERAEFERLKKKFEG